MPRSKSRRTKKTKQKRGAPRKKKGEAFQDLVGEVVSSFEPDAKVEVGEWVLGPDGRRELDVTVRKQVGSREVLLLIECKDYTYSRRSRPVGIGDIDAFESKRRDLGANFAVMASNSGFAQPALNKAARTGIGAITVLREGDPRGKVRITHNMYHRNFTCNYPITFEYIDEHGVLLTGNWEFGDAKIDGESIDQWLMLQSVFFQVTHPWNTRRIRADFSFRDPVAVTISDKAARLRSVAISFTWDTEWRQEAVEIGVSTGVVDYLAGLIVIPGGEHQITFKNIDFDNSPVCEPPARDAYRLQAPLKGQVGAQFCRAKNVGEIGVPSNSAISKLVIPEDLASVLEPMPDDPLLGEQI